MELHVALAGRVRAWRDAGYPHDDYPAIAEILGYAVDGEGPDAPLRYLRAAQLRALETYWYLRLVERTPRIADLYERMFDRTAERMTALALDRPELTALALDVGYAGLLERIRTDDEFVRAHRLETQRETLTLADPSWILALAMGAGKTVLIGAIVATEFAMALEYPDAGDDGAPFIENALVFAPGTTIVQSLREHAAVPYDRILPPRFHDRFAASLKVTFTRDGERDIPVARGSRFNLVVTNTEKIRIQTPTQRRGTGAAPARHSSTSPTSTPPAARRRPPSPTSASRRSPRCRTWACSAMKRTTPTAGRWGRSANGCARRSTTSPPPPTSSRS